MKKMLGVILILTMVLVCGCQQSSDQQSESQTTPSTSVEVSEADKSVIDENMKAVEDVIANFEKTGEISADDQEALLVSIKDLYDTDSLTEDQEKTLTELFAKLPKDLQDTINAIIDAADDFDYAT